MKAKNVFDNNPPHGAIISEGPNRDRFRCSLSYSVNIPLPNAINHIVLCIVRRLGRQ